MTENEIESMFDQDTASCKELAQNMYPSDPNQQLDQFLVCLGNQLAKVRKLYIIEFLLTLKFIYYKQIFS